MPAGCPPPRTRGRRDPRADGTRRGRWPREPMPLGPWAICLVPLPPAAIKRVAVDIESHAAGRAAARSRRLRFERAQVDRASLGLRRAACLVCAQPAVECIRLGRHRPEPRSAPPRGVLLLRVLAAGRLRPRRARRARPDAQARPRRPARQRVAPGPVVRATWRGRSTCCRPTSTNCSAWTTRPTSARRRRRASGRSAGWSTPSGRTPTRGTSSWPASCCSPPGRP